MVWDCGGWRSSGVYAAETHLESLGVLVHWLLGKCIATQVVYLTCCSGIVYCHLHDVPWFGRDERGQTSFFAGGSREQTGLEGWIISGIIVTVSLMFVLIAVLGEKCSHKFSVLFSLMALVVIYVGVGYL